MTNTFRKKPLEIQAIRFQEVFACAYEDWDGLPKWLADAYETGVVLFLHHPDRIVINTLEGDMTAQGDDWIIRGIKGELHPCKADIFEATYEPVVTPTDDIRETTT